MTWKQDFDDLGVALARGVPPEEVHRHPRVQQYISMLTGANIKRHCRGQRHLYDIVRDAAQDAAWEAVKMWKPGPRRLDQSIKARVDLRAHSRLVDHYRHVASRPDVMDHGYKPLDDHRVGTNTWSGVKWDSMSRNTRTRDGYGNLRPLEPQYGAGPRPGQVAASVDTERLLAKLDPLEREVLTQYSDGHTQQQLEWKYGRKARRVLKETIAKMQTEVALEQELTTKLEQELDLAVDRVIAWASSSRTTAGLGSPYVPDPPTDYKVIDPSVNLSTYLKGAGEPSSSG
jgi:hypothetical protein